MSASAATFMVDTTVDAVDADPGDGTCATAGGDCSLRAAVQEANATGAEDRIEVPAGTYLLTIAGDGEDAAATGDLDLTAAVTIAGAGPARTTIDGNLQDRVLDVLADADVSGVTLRNGRPGAAFSFGGCVFNEATLTMTDVAVHDCSADHGGGIHNDLGTLVLMQVSLSGNEATLAGGAIETSGLAEVMNVTVSGNTGSVASGIFNDADLTVASSTIVGNRISSSGSAVLKNTVLSGSSCSGVQSGGHNLDEDGSCGLSGTGDQSGVSAMLGPLQDNGGGTLTHALPSGSPAVDAGSLDCPPPAVDQRGEARPQDGDGAGGAVCDIGAFELVPGAATTTTTTTVPGGTTTTTTTVPGGTTTTTTTLPPGGQPLPGTKLLLKDKDGKPQKRKLVLMAKDERLAVPGDPAASGGTLRVRATAGDAFDVEYPLEALGWAPLKKKKPEKGWKYSKGDPIRKVILKTGKMVKIVGKGEGLQHTLATDPQPVDVVLTVGGARWCFRFGGDVTYKDGVKYLAKNAGEPSACPAD